MAGQIFRADLELDRRDFKQLVVVQRSVKRPRLSNLDRGFWVLVHRFWTDWDSVLVIVKPETVVRWHRAGFRRYWTWKSRKRRPGRPGVSLEVRELIRDMCRANVTWGAPRVHGELMKLGISISQAAVSLGKDAPEPRPVQAPSTGKVTAVPKVGGLHHYYSRLAA